MRFENRAVFESLELVLSSIRIELQETGRVLESLTTPARPSRPLPEALAEPPISLARLPACVSPIHQPPGARYASLTGEFLHASGVQTGARKGCGQYPGTRPSTQTHLR